MVWQLRVVTAVTGLLVVALFGALTVSTWAGRPRSRDEARTRLADARLHPGHHAGNLVLATRTGSWVLSALYLAMTLAAAVLFTVLAMR